MRECVKYVDVVDLVHLSYLADLIPFKIDILCPKFLEFFKAFEIEIYWLN